MWLDLRKIIESPGASQTFAVTLDPEHLTDPGIADYVSPPEASGKVVNTAGLLDLRATVRARMTCICDRCGKQFPREKVMEIEEALALEPAA